MAVGLPATGLQAGPVLHADPGASPALARYVSIGHNMLLNGCSVAGQGALPIGLDFRGPSVDNPFTERGFCFR